MEVPVGVGPFYSLGMVLLTLFSPPLAPLHQPQLPQLLPALLFILSESGATTAPTALLLHENTTS